MKSKLTILWLCNLPLPQIAESIGITKSYFGGWMEGLASNLDYNTIDLNICFFLSDIENFKIGDSFGIKYYAVPTTTIDEKRVEILVDVIKMVNPDVIHIFGTEYVHSNSMIRACENLGMIDKTLLSVQGLVSVYAKHYMVGIPTFWKYYMTLRDFVYNNTSIFLGKRDFDKRGAIEIETIKHLKNVSGRTDWDKACIYHINPQAKYYYCNEILRKIFYECEWSIENCQRHKIFVGQGNYPVKGLHFVLEALPLIIKHYPDAKLYVSGNDIVHLDGNWKTFLLREAYGRYLMHLIRKNNLQSNVMFLGQLDENTMCDNYLDSHVYVLPSNIENSPNSLGEAMMLGVPSIVSDVGGVKDMITHNVEGFVYQHNAPYMLAYYIMKIFENDNLAKEFSARARIKASITHNRQINGENMMAIYRTISGK